MLSQLKGNICEVGQKQYTAINPDDRWSRSMQEDMKEAIDLVFKFKLALDKLHPECLVIIERIISLPPRNF